MRVCKFEELNPFGSIMDALPNDPRYAKLITMCSTECDEMFCNKVKLRSLNLKNELFYLFIMESSCMDGLLT
jgi:hypothetical protein